MLALGKENGILNMPPTVIAMMARSTPMPKMSLYSAMSSIASTHPPIIAPIMPATTMGTISFGRRCSRFRSATRITTGSAIAFRRIIEVAGSNIRNRNGSPTMPMPKPMALKTVQAKNTTSTAYASSVTLTESIIAAFSEKQVGSRILTL